MRMLWTAELQARQFGVRGSTDPLDNSQLPLLATMQFDGFTNQGPARPGFLKHMGALSNSALWRGEKVFKLVKWPKESWELPALQQCLPLSGCCRCGCKLSKQVSSPE